MSQNKTVIQGLEPADTNVGGSAMGANSNFYSRGNRPAARGTVVPGMMDTNQDSAPSPQQDQKSYAQPKKALQPGKPVVGFLYSISRTAVGEFWPLQIGPNTIGQSADNDIVLAEGTVSSNHAVIVTRQVRGGIIAAITDAKSTNGTMINGEVIGFSAEECHDGDILTIGNNYELVLILVDAAKRGLSVSKDFVPVAVEEEDDDDVAVDDGFPMFNPGSTRPGGFDPYNGGGGPAWGTSTGYQPANGTVGLDGSISGGNHGGTVPM